MSRTRWIILVPVLVLLALVAWRFFPRALPFPYEGVNDPPPGHRDAGVRDAGPPVHHVK
jgi:hypothetical protein